MECAPGLCVCDNCGSACLLVGEKTCSAAKIPRAPAQLPNLQPSRVVLPFPMPGMPFSATVDAQYPTASMLPWSISACTHPDHSLFLAVVQEPGGRQQDEESPNPYLGCVCRVSLHCAVCSGKWWMNSEGGSGCAQDNLHCHLSVALLIFAKQTVAGTRPR